MLTLDPLEPRRLLASTPTFTVAIDDPRGVFSAYHDDVRGTLLAAANDWAQYIDSSAKIELLLDFDSSLRSPTLATAGFDRRVFFRRAGNYDIQLGNVAAELRTGRDQNGSAYDAFISLRPGALDEFYYDSSKNRTATIPGHLIDARTVLLHELGHVLGFFGDGDGPGDSPAGNRFVYDQYVQLQGNGDLYFTGPNAMSVYGGRVPLTFEDSSHLGNEVGPGEDLADDLMAPTIPDGARRFISELNLAMLADAGVPMKSTHLPSVQVSNVTVTRTGTPAQTATFVLTLTKPSNVAVSVPVQALSGSAVAGRDFLPLTRTIRFEPGQTSKTVSVKLLPGSLFDGAKTFFLNLGLPTNAALLRGQATATLKNGIIAADARHTGTLRTGGNVITINVRGPGVAVVNRDSDGALDTITLTGSSAATVLVIRGKRPPTLHGITARTGLGAVDAPNTDFSGAMRLVGASAVTLRNILPGSSLTFAAAPQPLSFTARHVFDSLIKTLGPVASFTTAQLRNSTLLARASVDFISVASALSSNVLVGTSAFPASLAEFDNRRAVLKTFLVRASGLFSDTRVAAPVINSATLGVIDVENASLPFGLAADRILSVSGSTALDSAFKRTSLRSPQEIVEDDFVVRVL